MFSVLSYNRFGNFYGMVLLYVILLVYELYSPHPDGFSKVDSAWAVGLTCTMVYYWIEIKNNHKGDHGE